MRVSRQMCGSSTVNFMWWCVCYSSRYISLRAHHMVLVMCDTIVFIFTSLADYGPTLQSLARSETCDGYQYSSALNWYGPVFPALTLPFFYAVHTASRVFT